MAAKKKTAKEEPSIGDLVRTMLRDLPNQPLHVQIALLLGQLRRAQKVVGDEDPREVWRAAQEASNRSIALWRAYAKWLADTPEEQRATGLHVWTPRLEETRRAANAASKRMRDIEQESAWVRRLAESFNAPPAPNAEWRELLSHDLEIQAIQYGGALIGGPDGDLTRPDTLEVLDACVEHFANLVVSVWPDKKAVTRGSNWRALVRSEVERLSSKKRGRPRRGEARADSNQQKIFAAIGLSVSSASMKRERARLRAGKRNK